MNRPALSIDDRVLSGFADEIGPEGPVAVEGGRTRWHRGGAPLDGTRLVRAPQGIVEYVPEEMIVKVRAGTTVAELSAALAERNQRTGLPDRGPDATVGGAVAVGENHPSVLGRGSLRSAVLQVRYVSAEGRLVTGGGPTVKNVTGFDLPRLMVGSLGTLGLLAEVIIRTNPIPPVTRWFCADDADPFLARDAVLAPSSVLWDGHRTWVELEGHGPDVAVQASALELVGSFAETDGPPPLPGHRWSLSPAQLRALPADLTPFVAVIGVGLVFASRPQPLRRVDPVVAGLNRAMKDNFDPTHRLNPGRDPARN